MTILFLCTILQVPQSEQEWANVATQFSQQWNFPNCLGALDGKHVSIVPPANCGSVYFNYKHFNSIILMALVDAGYRFLYVDVGSYGRVSDGGVFNTCTSSSALDSGMLHIPPECNLPGAQTAVPYVIVADDAFALKTFIMKPYGSRNLTREQRIFNYRLSRARRVVENAFGILCSRFRVFGRPIALSPEKVEVVVLAACCLHNFLLRNATSASQYIQDDTLPSCDLPKLSKQGGNRSSTKALTVREEFCRYFNSPCGSVSWQVDAIQ
jgi:DDE superfamily endonuclease